MKYFSLSKHCPLQKIYTKFAVSAGLTLESNELSLHKLLDECLGATRGWDVGVVNTSYENIIYIELNSPYSRVQIVRVLVKYQQLDTKYAVSSWFDSSFGGTVLQG